MPVRGLVNWISVAALALMIALLIYFLPRGLDFTDDSFYLLNARHPEYIASAISHFFFYTTHLFGWVDYDIISFRYLGALILLLVAISFARVYSVTLHSIFGDGSGFPAIYALLVFSCLYFYFWRWFPGPSYNWMNLIACQLFAIGLMSYIFAGEKKNILLCGVLIGLGGFIAFISKPPTAAVLALVAALFFLFSGVKKDWKLPVYAVVTCLLLFAYHVLVEFDGLKDYLQYLFSGVGLLNDLDDHHGMERMSRRMYVFWREAIGIAAAIGLIALLVFGIERKDGKFRLSLERLREQPAWFLFFVLLVTWAYALVDYERDKKMLSRVFVIIELSIFILASMRVRSLANIATRETFKKGALLFLLNFLVAFAMVFGTDVKPAHAMTAGMVFLVANLIICVRLLLIEAGIERTIVWAAAFVVPLLGWAVVEEIVYPHRLQYSLYQQDYYLSVDGGGVYVDKDADAYFRELRNATGNMPFREANRVLIDLTGHSPGVSLVLGSRPVGKAWLLGGREFSDIAVENMIAIAGEIPEDIWVLEAPTGERTVGRSALTNNGIRFPDNFELALEITHPCRKKKSGKDGCRVEFQRLWKPKSSAAAEAAGDVLGAEK